MQVAIVGGSAAGLMTGLLLARRGHRVTVLDRDRLPTTTDVERAAEHPHRPGAPQLAHPHVGTSLMRALLRSHLPDVLDALMDLGAVEVGVLDRMPESITDRSAQPGDEDLAFLYARRSTVDLALRTVVADEPNLTVRSGVRVVGLFAEPGDPPRVTGVHTQDGAAGADLVIDASGRRSAVDGWLSELGLAQTDLAVRECGRAYFSRYYRMRPEATHTRFTGIIGGPSAFFTALLFQAEHETTQLALAPLAEDTPLHALREPAVFEAVARTVPEIASRLEVSDPISPVYAMGGLHNTFRRLVVDGEPVVHGLLAVGDSVCTTNPTFGRGIALALRGAIDLADSVSGYAPDLDGIARATDRHAQANIHPWYRQQADFDEQDLAERRARLHGGDPPPPAPAAPGRVAFAELARTASSDPMLFRAWVRMQGMLSTPDNVLGDQTVVHAVRSADLSGGQDESASPTPPGPGREELLSVVASAQETE